LARGLQNMLAHGYQVAIQTVAGAGLFPHMVEDSLKAFLEQSSRFLHPVFVGATRFIPRSRSTSSPPSARPAWSGFEARFTIRKAFWSLMGSTATCCADPAIEELKGREARPLAFTRPRHFHAGVSADC
jgi:hypothetical protein